MNDKTRRIIEFINGNPKATSREIGKQFNCTSQNITNIRRRYNLPPSPRSKKGNGSDTFERQTRKFYVRNETSGSEYSTSSACEKETNKHFNVFCIENIMLIARLLNLPSKQLRTGKKLMVANIIAKLQNILD